MTKGGSNLPTNTVLHPRIHIPSKSAGRIIVKVGFLSLLLAFAGAFVPVAAQAVAQTYQLDIPRQQLDAALKDLAQQTGLQIARFSDTPGGGAFVGPVSGNMPVADALNTLLAPSKLTYKVVNDHTIAVMTLSAAAAAPTTSEAVTPNESISSPSAGDASGKDDPKEGKKSSDSFRVAQVDQTSAGPEVATDQDSRKKKEDGLSEIIVTGSHIRGAEPVGSPLKIYTREDIDKSGASTLEQFARTLPENFSSVDGMVNATAGAIGSPAGPGPSQGSNNYFSSAFNLHGLGPEATLTLLNGHRGVLGGNSGEFADISLIPVSAIDHIEVLPDGASAVYGSDAIAGVVNIVTRHDYQGAETTVRGGTSTRGGDDEFGVSQIVGTSWAGGNGMLDLDYGDQGGLTASQRSFIAATGTIEGPTLIVPKSRRLSAFVTGSQDLWHGATVSLDALFSDRHYEQPTTIAYSSVPQLQQLSGSVQESGLTLALDQQLPASWRLNAAGTFTKLDQSHAVEIPDYLGTDSSYDSISRAPMKTYSLDIVADGSLFALPGGAVKASLGSSFRSEQLSNTYFANFDTPPSSFESQRHIASAFGEILVPIITQSNALAWTKQLEFSAAIRSDHYSDFGSTTNPKFGMLWEPVAGFKLRSTYGTSFRAPELTQLAPIQATNTSVVTLLFPNNLSPTGTTDTLFYGANTNPSLRPERANSLNVGFDFQPVDIPSLKFSTTYYRTQFKNLIAQPPFLFDGADFSRPQLTPYITLNPSPALVTSLFNFPGFVDLAGQGISGVQAYVNDSLTNIAEKKVSGIDLSIQMTHPGFGGVFSAGIAGDRQLQNEYLTTLDAAPLQLLNSVGQPLKWKTNANLGWSNGRISGNLFIRYTNSYLNNVVVPVQTISSWTTADLSLAYQIPAERGSLLSGFVIALSVQNIADRDPPVVASAGIAGYLPYDGSNASPLGRVVSLRVTKAWGGRP
jgi:iron complex outermembrane receptor protein